MLSFYVVNLLVPEEPPSMSLSTPAGTWSFTKHPGYDKFKPALTGGQCAETYFLEHPASMAGGAASVDLAFDEITPLLLGAAYAAGLSVTIKRSTMGSDVSILQPSEHWPRERALDRPSPVVASATDFTALVERFVSGWPQAGLTEKARLLVHHWLDALGCWSMEDLYLSATTLLQVIVASEATKQGLPDLPYYKGVEAAANRMGIRVLGPDFKDMRNELIHDGQLIGRRFAGPAKADCARVVADVLNWFDEYMHAALSLGPVRKQRFRDTDLAGLNAYSID